MTPKKILFVTRKAPYGSGLSKEALDALLASSAYGQDIALLFMDDGLFQLLADQDPKAIDAKNFAAQLPVLPMYDIEKIYAAQSSLQARGLDSNNFVLPVTTLTDAEVSQLFQDQDVVLSF